MGDNFQIIADVEASEAEAPALAALDADPPARTVMLQIATDIARRHATL